MCRKGRLDVSNILPGHPTNHSYPYQISKSDEDMTIKDSKNVWKVLHRTYYTDVSELTYEEKDHLISFIIEVENYNINYETHAHYGQHVPLVHVLNYGNIHGDGIVRFFTITTYVHLLHKFF